jgi:membrane protease YdiL (CAAX protease family)
MSNASTKTHNFWDPWGWLGVVTAVVWAFISQIIAGVTILLGAILVENGNQASAQNWLTNSILAQFLFVLMAEAIAVAAVYIYLRLIKNSPKSIGLRRPQWLDLGWGALVFTPYLILYVALIVVVSHIFPGLNVNEKQQVGFNNANGAIELILTFFSLVVLPPIAEEILFRGLLYTNLKRLMPLLPAAIVTSLLFALPHIGEGGSAGPLYIAGIDTFTLSLFLVYLRERTGGLYASMTLHALKNGLAFIVLFVLHSS